MSRLERIFWGMVYFGAGLGAIVLLATAMSHSPLRGAAGAVGGAAIILLFSAWRSFRRRITRDLAWGTRTVVMRLRVRLNPLTVRFLTHGMIPGDARGLVVYDVANTPEERAARNQKVARAIDLIQEFWPSRYRRLLRLAPRILVAEFRPYGAYFVGTDLIYLHSGLVDLWQPESVACVLCHELLHYHIRMLGVDLSPWAETRSELLTDSEMGLWARRLVAAGRNTPQIQAELLQIIYSSRERRWWSRDGSRFRGSELGKRGTAGAGVT